MPFKFLIAGERWLIFRRNRVEVIRRRNHWNAKVQFLRSLQERQHDIATAIRTLRLDHLIEGLTPLGRFLRVGIYIRKGVRVLVVHSHVQVFQSVVARKCGELRI
ncbi:unannotated protein [freshwater metagenome]|uniref:Unannotated protein n=1 Tax=freshwater metagenome TaxID=449393 RepID=A0A6J6F9D3_9ZZZZ